MQKLRRRPGGMLAALTALLTLFAVSFAHVHLDAPGVGGAGSETALDCRVFFKPSDGRSCPPVDDDLGHCEVCGLIAAASSAVAPELPTLDVVWSGLLILAPPRDVLPHIARTRSAFDARAPPA